MTRIWFDFPRVWVDKLSVTVVVPIRQMKDIDQHISWNSGPVCRDLKQKASKKKKEEDTGKNS